MNEPALYLTVGCLLMLAAWVAEWRALRRQRRSRK